MCKHFFTPTINSFGEQTNWLSNAMPNQVWGMCVCVRVCCTVTLMLRVDSLGMPGGSLRLARGALIGSCEATERLPHWLRTAFRRCCHS